MTKLKNYKCVKCGKVVELVFLPGMSEETFKLFSERLKVALCRNCYTEKTTAEKYYN